MAHVDFSSTARSELRKILNGLQRRAGTPVAVNYIDAFDAAFDEIRDFPGIGAPRGKLGRGIRMLIVSPYLIFYEGGPKAKSVVVLRILHGSRRITRRAIAASRDDPDA